MAHLRHRALTGVQLSAPSSYRDRASGCLSKARDHSSCFAFSRYSFAAALRFSFTSSSAVWSARSSARSAYLSSCSLDIAFSSSEAHAVWGVPEAGHLSLAA